MQAFLVCCLAQHAYKTSELLVAVLVGVLPLVA